ncbi:hypothetical protein BJV82DRAFT_605151 [Fennellomyces sp. T-0311]|nr:hypothetical protein BJV82DRAFT_605151 [Fennellomyces sp. T-0311]
MAEEDKCEVCDNGDSRTSNQILYCDGKDCDMPVHQLCYGVAHIPENDWYCERCKAKRFNKKVEVVCCPQQTGAMKRAAHPGEFMHIVCAAYNKDVQHEREPYHYNKSILNTQRCSICNQLQGLCIRCEYPGCTTYFHAQCGVHQGLIHVGYPMPIHNRVYCIQHTHAAEGNITKDPITPAKRSTSPLVSSPPKQFKENKVGNSNGVNGDSSMTEMSNQLVKGRLLGETDGSSEAKRPKLALTSKPPAKQKQQSLSLVQQSQPRPTAIINTSSAAATGLASVMSSSTPSTPKMITPPLKPPKPSTPASAPTPAPSTALVSSTSRITQESLKQTEIDYLTARLEDTKKDLKKAQEKANEVKSVEKRLQETQQQIERMRKEMQQQKDFKRAVTDIFMALNIRIANNTAPSPHKMDEYVRLLRDTLNRTGPPSENEWIQIVNLSNKLAMEKRK